LTVLFFGQLSVSQPAKNTQVGLELLKGRGMDDFQIQSQAGLRITMFMYSKGSSQLDSLWPLHHGYFAHRMCDENFLNFATVRGVWYSVVHHHS
jgi:hypothetical protein